MSKDTEAEEWRPVIGYEGIYEISSLGRMRTLGRSVRRGKHKYTVRTCIRRPATDLCGYKYVTLTKTATRDRGVARIHRLVLEAFVGPLPCGMETRHLNGDCRDNKLGNLVYGSKQENTDDRGRHGRHCRGEKCGTAKITRQDVGRIFALRQRGLTHKQISDEVGVSRRQVGRILNKERWAWLTNIAPLRGPAREVWETWGNEVQP